LAFLGLVSSGFIKPCLPTNVIEGKAACDVVRAWCESNR
jgi:hypothetical protein